MTQEAFLSLVKDSVFLGEARQQELITNAAWMTPEERAALAKNIDTAGEKMQQDSEFIGRIVDELEEDLQTFKKSELQDAVQEQEQAEQGTDQETAEHLLDDF